MKKKNCVDGVFHLLTDYGNMEHMKNAMINKTAKSLKALSTNSAQMQAAKKDDSL